MVDEIKFGSVGIPLTYDGKANNTKNKEELPPEEGAVTVSNNLGKLVNLMQADAEGPDEAARVTEMKNRIQSGAYKIDPHALTEKLMDNGVIKLSDS